MTTDQLKGGLEPYGRPVLRCSQCGRPASNPRRVEGSYCDRPTRRGKEVRCRGTLVPIKKPREKP